MPDEEHTQQPRGGRNALRWAGWALALILAIGAGYLLHALLSPAEGTADTAAANSAAGGAEAEEQIWTCSMHPQIRKTEPGLCPICGMELIPAEDGGGEGDAPVLTVSEHARRLMEVETAPVERKFVEAQVRMVGKVEYDQTKVADVTAWMAGRLDRLFVDYAGAPVRKGDHMVYIYSPELLSAQEELLQAIRTAEDLQESDSGILRETADATVVAAREKLRLLGLTPGQILQIEQRGTASDHLTINAPVSGIVVEKHANEGAYVQTGTKIYTVADLTRVWVELDAYESELSWIRYGQEVTFQSPSYPGETFTGRISLIDPILDRGTRTVSVRLNAANPDGRLKPGMYVEAVARASVAAGGKVMDPDLAGRWVCPMHPGEVEDEPGDCDLCGMPLVRTESLGYLPADADTSEAPLVIPVSAALVTGKRAVVYIEREDEDGPTFEGREVVLGPRAGDHYIVREGLEEGQRVVVRGNFKIDSALQISAKPSMMSPREEYEEPESTEPDEPTPAEAKAPTVESPAADRLEPALKAYFDMQSALASDDLSEATAAAGRTLDALEAAQEDGGLKHAEALCDSVVALSRAETLENAREAFALVSEMFPPLAEAYARVSGDTVYRMHCPMAFNNRGADWLQADRGVRNPFFGAAMSRCGEVADVMGPDKEQDTADE